MAEAVFFTNKRTLECSICLQMYNLTDRIPKVLRCGHSFCESCLDSLKEDSVIKCPKDRTDSSVDDLVTSFGITDILDTLCEDCSSQEKSIKCYHCEQTICTKCLEMHAPSYHSDLRSELDELENLIFNTSGASSNANFLELEKKKAQDITDKVRQAIKTRRAALDQIEKDLEEEVKRIKKHNSEQCFKWKTKQEQLIIEAKQFQQQANQTMGTAYTPQCTMEAMHNIQDQSNRLSVSVMDSKDKYPLVTGYSFIETTGLSKLNPGEIILSGPPEAVALYKVPQEIGQSADIYRTARFKCMTGSQGSGTEEFDSPMYVASMDDRLIITDMNNHRIKIYDHNLHLLHLHGSKGGNPCQFDHPVGVTVNTDNDIIVSDFGNKRITLFTKYCIIKYCFGKGRSTNIDIDNPTGICVDKIGNIYVCEQNQNRVKSMTKAGKFLRNYGDSDAESGKLKDKSLSVVTVVHAGKLLISSRASKVLNVFTTTGHHLDPIPTKLPDTLYKGQPTGIAIDKYNNIIYTDVAGYLVVLNQQGEFVCTIGSPGKKPGEFNQPRGLNITPQGDIVVCDNGNHRVQIFEVC